MHPTTAVLVLLLLTASAAQGPSPESVAGFRCDVTTPNEKSTAEQSSPDAFGNQALSVWLGWRDGTVTFRPGGPGLVLEDGALSMKFGWERHVRGALTIDGQRLDAAAPPLRASIPCCYEESSSDRPAQPTRPTRPAFQSTALIFPTPGCWKVNGHVADSTLTFVVRVVKERDGPVAR